MASTDKIEQAVTDAKWGGAKNSLVAIVAEMCGLPEEAVATVATVIDGVRAGGHAPWAPIGELPEQAVKTLTQVARLEVHKAVIRRTAEQGETFEVPFNKLYARKPHGKELCRGCPFSIPCAAENLSTPAKCWRAGFINNYWCYSTGTGQASRRRNRTVIARPVRIIGDAVEITVEHPPGTHTIAITETPCQW